MKTPSIMFMETATGAKCQVLFVAANGTLAVEIGWYGEHSPEDDAEIDRRVMEFLRSRGLLAPDCAVVDHGYVQDREQRHAEMRDALSGGKG